MFLHLNVLYILNILKQLSHSTQKKVNIHQIKAKRHVGDIEGNYV
jgi:hypothetical protein